jgi:pentatricopeptide repeat protein
LSYEAKRRAIEKQCYSPDQQGAQQGTASSSQPPSLDMEGYKCVLKAHSHMLDMEGMFSTLDHWNQTDRLISTTLHSDIESHFVTPDSSVYKLFITFFHVHPQMITTERLKRLFEQMQLDHVTPQDNKDIISLFTFANKAHSTSMTNTLLKWVSDMRGQDNESPSDPESSLAPDIDDIMNTSALSSRFFPKTDLVKIYDLALETNTLQIDNGDKSLEILFAMKRDSIALNANRVALVMKALKNSKNFEAVLELFHSMVALNVKRDTYHVSLAVVAYLRTDQVDRGLALLERFEEAGQELKKFTYFAAAFELMRRLCVRPQFIPIPLNNTDPSGDITYMQQKEAVRAFVLNNIYLSV